MSFPVDDAGGKIIAKGEFFHPLDASPAYFTHWSTLANLGPVTITIENQSAFTINVKITRFSEPDIDIDVNGSFLGIDNNRSVTVAGAKALQIQESADGDVEGDYLIVLN